MKLKYVILAIFLLSLSLNVYSQDKKHFKLSAFPSVMEVKKGENFKVKIILRFDKDWYTYDITEQLSADGIGPTPTEFFVRPDDMAVMSGKIIAPKPHTKHDDGFEMEIKYYNGEIEFELPLKAKKDLNFKKDTLKAGVFMQLCDQQRCLPPEEFLTELTLESYGESDKGGILSFLWIAISAGALALLTPCVFPMVPITVSFFAKRSETAKGKGLRDALVYAIGIIITFTALGFIFSLLFGASGIQDFAKSPGVYLFIAAIFLLFTFNLFGAYEIQMPTGLMNKLNTKSMQGSGVGSVILMGLTFSLASFSCTGPLVGAALIAASTGEWFYPIISMIGFSATLALPFFFLALFPSALNSLPKAGGWMNNMKVVLGFIVLATSLYFINNALIQWGGGLSREVFLSIWIGIFTLTSLYILGIFKLKSDSKLESVGSLRLIFALIFASLTFYLVGGLFGMNLGELETYVPQSEKPAFIMASGTISGGVQAEALGNWLENYDEALAIAKKENKPIFIDFTGKTCTNCKKMEKNMFTKASIIELLSKMVKVKLTTDINKEPYLSNKKFQLERFKSVAIPLYVILTPEGEVIATEVYNDSEEDFKAFLMKAFN
ncbi:DUF255 domain-containing protein [Bacteroidetes/Chlorobi group bacterium ChocPot_Mid]|nr:MAG: DUF255 domain-containing protein [Bacteroidetes/Chlorobi group bacterium ChocPot_Mid]